MYDDVCIQCKAGFHDRCSLSFTGELEPGAACCCNGLYDSIKHWQQIAIEEALPTVEGAGSTPSGSTRQPNAIGGVTTNYDGSQRKRGNSGYIAPAAWSGPKDIGTLADPESTGRKRVVKMYPIPPGTVCEWANLAAAGGGVHPIIGCLGNPATDWHHGPDKNTLDNEKVSLGIGESENVHIICSFCHNGWHTANDDSYPDYDRNAQQAEPWLPVGEFAVHDPETRAPFEVLTDTERARREKAEAHGLQRRGRAGVVIAIDPDDNPDEQ